MKTTFQILYDKGLFDYYAYAEEVLKNFLFTTRRRPDLLEQVNDDIQRFFRNYKLKNQATSNINIQQVLSSSSLSDIVIYLRDGAFLSDIGSVNLHPSKGTHWVLFINENYFYSDGCSPPQKLSNFFYKKKGTLFLF